MSEFINNASKRKDALKAIIRKLHAGESVESLQEEFNEVIAEASASDIAQAEREVIAEGLPVADIQKLCDLHVAVFQQGLESQPAPESVPGHPVYNFRLENEVISRVLESIEGSLARVLAGDKNALKSLRLAAGNLNLIERHYEWKENLLFPVMEKYGFEGPSKVMWGVHNDIRKAIRNLQSLMNSDPLDLETVDAEYLDMAKAVRDMFYKEEKVLLPEALTRLSQADWDMIKAESLSLKKDAATAEPAQEEAPVVASEGKISLSTGALTQEQINLMLTNLPVDITFVDENDKVCFFSQTSERIFVRTAAIIGRSVQNCHPPQSVHVVQGIVDDFRAGKRDVAEFWIQMGGKFVHIRYFALRDPQGAYKGVIEVTQDVSAIRALEGERRLLDDKA
ncbi:MAG: DUF438 domain-containing protein [Chloroflexi bacterium]|nr:DUF438 domain-containing protein [Chloroflexota bacterium]